MHFFDNFFFQIPLISFSEIMSDGRKRMMNLVKVIKLTLTHFSISSSSFIFSSSALICQLHL